VCRRRSAGRPAGGRSSVVRIRRGFVLRRPWAKGGIIDPPPRALEVEAVDGADAALPLRTRSRTSTAGVVASGTVHAARESRSWGLVTRAMGPSHPRHERDMRANLSDVPPSEFAAGAARACGEHGAVLFKRGHQGRVESRGRRNQRPGKVTDDRLEPSSHGHIAVSPPDFGNGATPDPLTGDGAPARPRSLVIAGVLSRRARRTPDPVAPQSRRWRRRYSSVDPCRGERVPASSEALLRRDRQRRRCGSC